MAAGRPKAWPGKQPWPTWQGPSPRMTRRPATWLSTTSRKSRSWGARSDRRTWPTYFLLQSNPSSPTFGNMLKETRSRLMLSSQPTLKPCPRCPTGIQLCGLQRKSESIWWGVCFKSVWLTFNRSSKPEQEFFFVKKKTPDAIRLIVDGRQANFNHRRPPVTRLGSATCLAELRLRQSQTGYGREMDVSDCFYQFRVDQAAAWFGLDDPRPYGDWQQLGFQVDDVYDYRLGHRRPTSPDEVLYPVVSAMSMGWSWALWLANETVAAIVRESSRGPYSELRERHPTPQLQDHHTITSTYVSNVTVFGDDYEQVKLRCDEVDKAFEERGILVVWSQDYPVQSLETIGCKLDLLEGTLKNKPLCLWRVYLAGMELCRRGRVNVAILEAWLGHATSLFRLRPCLLSIFDKIYRFIGLGRDKRMPLWPSVKKEIKLASQLVWLSQVNLRSPFVVQLDAGDSADHGYALMTRGLADYELQRIIKFREKWRYVPLPADLQETLNSGDRTKLLKLIEQKTGFFLPQNCEDEAKDRAQVRSGLGLDIEYGQWLQHVLAEGDWLKISAIQTQKKLRPKKRADIDWPALVEPVRQEVLQPGRFRLLWARRWKDPTAHINIKEGLVALSSLKRTARVASPFGATKVTLCDNLAVVLYFDKGRSSSPGMNRLCRVAAAFQVGLNLTWRLRHIESPRNIADVPSRWFEKHRNPSIRHIEMEQINKVAVLKLDSYLHRRVHQQSQQPPPGFDHTCFDSKDMGRSVSSTVQSMEQFFHDKTMQSDVQDEGESTQKMFSEMSQGINTPASSSKCKNTCTSTRDLATSSGPNGAMLEIFVGTAMLSDACRRRGIFVMGSLDIKNGTKFDLTKQHC